MRVPGLARRRLRTRIIAWSFVPTAIILFAVALATFYAYQRVTEDLVVERSLEVTRLSAGQLSSSLGNYAATLESLARTSAFYRGGPVTTAQGLRQAANRLAVFDGGVVVLDLRGQVIAAEPGRYDILNEDWSNRVYYRDLLRVKGDVFSDLVEDGAAGAPVVVVAVPILTEEGELRGALLGMFRLGATAVSSFYGDIVRLRQREGTRTYLTDGNNRLLFHPDSTRVGGDFSGQAGVAEALAGESGARRTRDVDGREVVAGFAPVPGTRWALISEESWSALSDAGQGYRRFLLVLLGLGLLLPSLVVHFGVRRLTRPIHELTRAAGQVAGGDFGHSINVATGDELEELAVQFNRMSAELRESYGELERRVADRTKELATLNTISLVTSGSLELQPILTAALITTMAAMEMDAGVAYRLDPEGDHFLLLASQQVPDDVLPRFQRIPLERWASLGEELTHPYVRYLDEGALADEITQRMMGHGFKVAIDVPLIAKGQLHGLLTLGSRRARRLEQEEISLLASIGGQIGVALDNARLYEEAEQTATRAERGRLARELHDAVSQTLFSTTLIAEVLPRLWEKNPAEAQRRLEELRQLTRGALAEMRTLLLELRPSALLEADLTDLLRQLAESVTGRARIPVSLELVGEGETDLGDEVKVTFYRVAQEALNNVAKHSNAGAAAMSLRFLPQEVTLRITDDGRGFDVEAAPADRLGLNIMRERADLVGATLEIKSRPGQGTEIGLAWSRRAAPASPDAGDGWDGLAAGEAGVAAGKTGAAAGQPGVAAGPAGVTAGRESAAAEQGRREAAVPEP